MALAAEPHDMEAEMPSSFRPTSRSNKYTYGRGDWVNVQNVNVNPYQPPKVVRPHVPSPSTPQRGIEPSTPQRGIEPSTPQCCGGPPSTAPGPCCLPPVSPTPRSTGLVQQRPTTPNTGFHTPLQDTRRSDDYYRKYMELSQNVAYKFPNPGPPRERNGNIGGHWRHIKEVLGHSGTRVVFVDGLVRLYDTDVMRAGRRRRYPTQPYMQTPVYSENRQMMQEKGPWTEPESGRGSALDYSNNMMSNKNKYKGFYAYN